MKIKNFIPNIHNIKYCILYLFFILSIIALISLQFYHFFLWIALIGLIGYISTSQSIENEKFNKTYKEELDIENKKREVVSEIIYFLNAVSTNEGEIINKSLSKKACELKMDLISKLYLKL